MTHAGGCVSFDLHGITSKEKLSTYRRDHADTAIFWNFVVGKHRQARHGMAH
jgi:hypothetical protein